MSDRTAPVVVIGGGIAGLLAAHELARHGVAANVYEAGPRIAGMAATHTDEDGFSYDVGAHFVTNRFMAALGMRAACRTLPRYGEVVRLGPDRHPLYPIGLLGVPRFVRSAIWEKVRRPKRDLLVAADRFRRDFGRALADEVALPLLEAWSGLPADELSSSVIDKLPTSLAKTIWLRAAQRITRRAVMIGYCKEEPSATGVFHVYPEGGIAAICGHVADGLASPVQVSSPAERIYTDGERVIGARIAGQEIETSTVISTLPINRLSQLVEGTDRLDRFRRFQFRGLVLVNLKLTGRQLLPEVIVWTPKGFPYFRVTEASLAMPWIAPEGKTMILCEFGAQPGDDVWSLSDEAIIERCLSTIGPMIAGVRERFIGASVLRQPLGYPVFALDYEPDRASLATEGTGIAGLHSVGRNGEFDHILMEDTFWRLRRRIPGIAQEHLKATHDHHVMSRPR
ncbi:MAG: FAD-dependent oxidoreductase [Actinobacteria bacterium]|nr:FAD-dependent oxidoreductase [Actinomycetota bacterium]